jgi:hypothetical protein
MQIWENHAWCPSLIEQGDVILDRSSFIVVGAFESAVVEAVAGGVQEGLESLHSITDFGGGAGDAAADCQSCELCLEG